MTKSSTPDSFTIRYVDYSYNVAPTYGTDQYTGKTVIIQEGYHVNNMSIEFTIKNQLFTVYADSSGNQIGLYYNFRHKGAYETEWSYYPFAPNGITTSRYGENVLAEKTLDHPCSLPLQIPSTPLFQLVYGICP